MPIKQKGFTLIEILVVLLIIGITLGFALLSFGDFGAKKQMVTVAEKFVNTIKAARFEAILQDKTFGVRVDKKGYQVARFESNTHWENILSRRIYQHQSFPNNAVIHFKNNASNNKNMQIIITPTGEVSSFQLIFGLKGQENMVQVVTKSNGNIQLEVLRSS